MIAAQPMLFPHQYPDPEEEVPYPILVQEKLNGVRMLITPEGVLTRNFKSFGNRQIEISLKKYVQKVRALGLILDCEFLSQMHPWEEHVRIINEKDAEVPPEFSPHAFDALTLEEWDSVDQGWCKCPPYEERHKRMKEYFPEITLPYSECWEVESLDDVYEEVLCGPGVGGVGSGEGLILRIPGCGYKHGRVTFNECSAWKLKPVFTMDGVVIDYKPMKRSMAAPEVDAFGHTHRPKHVDSTVEVDMLGAIRVETAYGKFWCGTGFTHEQRIELWNDAEEGKLIGRHAEIACIDKGGLFPRFVRWRNDKAE